MANNTFDLYFHLASHGNKEAYNLLYEAFIQKANLVVISTFKNNSKYMGFSDDFCGIIDDLFFYAINNFEPEKTSFSTFVDYLLYHKLVGAVKSEIHRIQTYVAEIDFDDNDVNGIELVSDPIQPSIQSEILIKNFQLSIASPNKNKTQKRRLRDRVLILQYAGYKNKEICEKLKITYAQLRRIYEKMKDDEELLNIKLDLK